MQHLFAFTRENAIYGNFFKEKTLFFHIIVTFRSYNYLV